MIRPYDWALPWEEPYLKGTLRARLRDLGAYGEAVCAEALDQSSTADEVSAIPARRDYGFRCYPEGRPTGVTGESYAQIDRKG